jgi:hypothetical protein
MIDIENQVYTALVNAIRAEYPNANIKGEYVKSPSTFPCVTIVEIDNSVYEKTSSNTLENHADVTYEVNIYSNKKSGKKSECKAIAKIIDSEFATLGFSRTMLQPFSNVEDATIYRILGRYRAVVSTDHTIYRR